MAKPDWQEIHNLTREHLARYPDRPAPPETYAQFKRGEIPKADFYWLIGKSDAEGVAPAPKPKGKFLISHKRKKAAHHWTGKDTICRLYSTGGMLKSGYVVTTDIGGRSLCALCAQRALRVR